jgi:hypothetical protein
MWETCHIGIGGTCVNPPFSTNDYARFATGLLETDGGDVRVGQLTMGIGHASMRANAAQATAHYDQSDAVIADIAIGEDAHGIWFSGAFREHVPDSVKREVRATAKVSGDWRKHYAGQPAAEMDLVGIVVVNTPGFPIPRMALAASGGEQTALVAAGMVLEEGVQMDEIEKLAAVARASAQEVLRQQKRDARLAAVRTRAAALQPQLAAARADRIARAKARVQA